MLDQPSDLSIEQRVAALETAVNQLREQSGNDESKGNWLEQITGSFKDDPVFDEILRYGREFRHSDYPSDDDRSEGE